jgi:hypothetical protein
MSLLPTINSKAKESAYYREEKSGGQPAQEHSSDTLNGP